MYPKEYIDFLIHFHGDRDYFECHEILEDYWKEIDPGNKESHWVGLILLAVSTYHHRRGNFKGAKRTLEKALRIFRTHPDSLSMLGIDGTVLFELINERLRLIETEQEYTSFSFPLNDPHLLETCLKSCREHGFEWGKDSDLTNDSLIHRHSLRDRTNVIEERSRMLTAKRGGK